MLRHGGSTQGGTGLAQQETGHSSRSHERPATSGQHVVTENIDEDEVDHRKAQAARGG